MLHLQAGSPVLARNAHSTASGHMLPRAQVRPLLGGGVGFRGTGFRPKKVESLSYEGGWSCVRGLCELTEVVDYLTISSV